MIGEGKKNFYTVQEVADMLRVGDQQVRSWLREGLFENAIRPGRRWLIPHEDLMKVIRAKHGR